VSNLDFGVKVELETVHTKVTRVLREAILRGDIAPGARLIQEELASSLGVSRMPIREALRKLEMEGLISIEPHRGAVVKSFNVEDIEEIYSLRAQFEKQAVEKSVTLLGQEEIEKLTHLVGKMEDAKEAEVFVESNIEFHNLLMSCCPWKRLLFIIENLWNGFPQQTPHLLLDHTKKSNKEHKDILEAVKEGNAQLAAERVAKHIERTGSELIAKLKSANNDID
jgi:DNA-binding GntR family transcriptional regulator